LFYSGSGRPDQGVPLPGAERGRRRPLRHPAQGRLARLHLQDQRVRRQPPGPRALRDPALHLRAAQGRRARARGRLQAGRRAPLRAARRRHVRQLRHARAHAGRPGRARRG